MSLDSLWPPPPYFMLLEDHHIADAFVLCIRSVSACGMHALISSVRAALQMSETHVAREHEKFAYELLPHKVSRQCRHACWSSCVAAREYC